MGYDEVFFLAKIKFFTSIFVWAFLLHSENITKPLPVLGKRL